MNTDSPATAIRPIRRLLVANRGEIACRIIEAARALGIETVAVFSPVDRLARHVAMADLALPVGHDASQGYLDGAALVAAALRAQAQAIHPGYGFLSENPDFSAACEAAGLVFVGPGADAMRALGNKTRAKSVAQQAQVPCLPAAVSGESLNEAAARLGYPLMVKAAAGGGGRGMRRVARAQDLEQALAGARVEALAGFGSDELLIEPWVEHARHVEVQVLADRHGHIIHLGERDCSTQRRHQKILEEAPAPGVDDALRAAMGDAAVRLAGAVGYVGAGTVEFLLHPDNRFSFLEMNTRLQVEHPVTEAVTGIDLVQWQLRIAAGEPLTLQQADIRWHGHAIEARLCAEDADQGFAPQAGDAWHWHLPAGPGLRIDHAFPTQPGTTGAGTWFTVSPHYDSMLAKLIAHAPDRALAIERLADALARTEVHGLVTNRAFLARCLRDPAFTTPTLSTGWLALAQPGWPAPAADAGWTALLAACIVRERAARHGPLGGWAATLPLPGRLVLQGPDGIVEPAVTIDRPPERGAHEVVADWSCEVTLDGNAHRVIRQGGHQALLDDVPVAYRYSRHGAQAWLQTTPFEAGALLLDHRPTNRDSDLASGQLRANLHGRVARINVAPGEQVEAGQSLITIEAMKIEHRIDAPWAGRVQTCQCQPGDQVRPGDELLLLAALDDPAA
ncbi:MAG: biotin carboxylase N-terminal domain-containing protein [Burkholderiaceae bacterium]